MAALSNPLLATPYAAPPAQPATKEMKLSVTTLHFFTAVTTTNFNSHWPRFDVQEWSVVIARRQGWVISSPVHYFFARTY